MVLALKYTYQARSLCTNPSRNEELGRPVSIGEVFTNTHTKPDGTLVDVKAKNIAEAYTMKLSDLKAPNSEALDGDATPPELSIDAHNELFLQCTLRDDRGRPFGLGSLQNTLANGKQIAAREAENSRLVAAQQNKLDHLSLVEKFLRATDPEFVDFINSQAAPQIHFQQRNNSLSTLSLLNSKT